MTSKRSSSSPPRGRGLGDPDYDGGSNPNAAYVSGRTEKIDPAADDKRAALLNHAGRSSSRDRSVTGSDPAVRPHLLLRAAASRETPGPPSLGVFAWLVAGGAAAVAEAMRRGLLE
jgi:hypothetical protein